MVAHHLRRARVVALVVLVAALCSAGAARPVRAASSHAAPPATGDSRLSAAQANEVLAILHDPAKRAAFTSELDAFAAAARHHDAAKGATPAGLAPESLGAALITTAGAFGSNLGAEGREIVRVVQRRHDFQLWVRGIAEDPAERALVIGSVWRLSIILAIALGVVVAVERALRRPIAALGRMAAARPDAPPPDAHDDPSDDGPDDAPGAIDAAAAVRGGEHPRDLALSGAGDPPPLGASPTPASPTPASPTEAAPTEAAPTERERDRRRRVLGLARLLHALRRIPFALAHLVLQLVPTIAFAAVVAIIEATGTVGDGSNQIVIGAAVHSFVVGGLLIALLNTLFAPETPALRLVLLRDQPSRRIAAWVRPGIVFGAFGSAGIVTASGLGLPPFAANVLVKIVALVEHVLLAGLIVASRHDVARRLQPPRRVRGAARRILAGSARRWWLYALFFDFAFWLIWAAEVRNGLARLWTFSVETVVIILFGRLCGIAALGALERAMHVDTDAAEQLRWFEARANRYNPVLRRLLIAALVVATAVALLQVWGFDAFAWFERGALGGRVLGAATSVLLSLVVGVVVWEAVNTAVDRHLDHLRADTGNAARIARINTLLPMLRILLFIFVATVVVLTMLAEIGVDIAPLLGGAGILGVAIGFGSQKLVQDFITGIFLLLENTMQVGDNITAGGLSGAVEHLSIRTMRLRAGDGSVHIIPFSSVGTVTNTNRGLGNAAVSVDIDPAEDTDRAANVLKEIALAMRDDEQFGPGMLSDLQFWGVNALTGQAVTLAGQIVCTDAARWGVQREFMRRTRIRFAADGIRLATPIQRVDLQAPDAGRDRAARFAAAGDDPEHESAPALTESPAPNALGHDS